MPNRILKESICTSPTLETLSAEEERLFYRLMVQCDDYGRMDARLAVVRARCFPLLLRKIRERDVQHWLEALRKAGLLTIYTAEGGLYLQLSGWERHQQVRAKRSKYPAPPASNGTQPQSSAITCAQMSPYSGSESNPDPEREGLLLAADSGNGTRRASRAAPKPPDFELTEGRKGFAEAGGLTSVPLIFGAFKDYHRAHGNLMRDWDAAWRSWCRKELDIREQRARRMVR